jgi:phosphotriesterase-related protein
MKEKRSVMKGFPMTVLGPVSANALGVTYAHEHLLVKPQLEDEKYVDYTLDSVEKTTEEVEFFKAAGGETIVEMTPIHYGRDVAGYAEISKRTGVHIICCTGYHKKLFMPPWFSEKTDEALYKILMNDIGGMDGTRIRPGVIKAGTSLNEIAPEESRAIEAVARVHLETGIPISTHCERGTMGDEQVKRFKALGVDPAHILLGHIDSSLDVEYACRLCEMGANICIDHIGRERADRDAFRVGMIATLVSRGYGGQVFLSGDMGKKNYLQAYGGTPGLRYILTDLKSALLEKISISDFERITIENPRRFFSGE